MSAGRFPQRIKRGLLHRDDLQDAHQGLRRVHGRPLQRQRCARCRRMFNSYVQTHTAATATAAELAVGRPEVHTLTGHELVIYRRALKALNGTGIDLDVAVTQFAQATKVLAKDRGGHLHQRSPRTVAALRQTPSVVHPNGTLHPHRLSSSHLSPSCLLDYLIGFCLLLVSALKMESWNRPVFTQVKSVFPNWNRTLPFHFQ